MGVALQEFDEVLDGSPRTRRAKQATQGLLEFADSWNNRVLFCLGVAFGSGVGVKQDLAIAFKWYRWAAGRIHYTAVYNLSRIVEELPPRYSKRLAVEATLLMGAYEMFVDSVFDYAEHLYHEPFYEGDRTVAMWWYARAAQRGHQDSRYAVAHAMMHGIGWSENPPLAARIFRQLAKAGHAPSMYQLAAAYYKGSGLRQNAAASDRWLAKSAEQGYSPAVCEWRRYGGLRQVESKVRQRTDESAE